MRSDTLEIPNAIDKRLAVNAAQFGIWLGQQLNPTSPFYNACECIEISGPLNEPLFIQAITSIIEQSDCLHAVFKTEHDSLANDEDSETEQVYQVLSEPKCAVNIIDLTREAQPKEAAQRWIKTHIAEVVHLESGPLFKQSLIRLGNNHWLWVQRIHHIACDGYAFALIAKKTFEIYGHLVKKDNVDAKVFGSFEHSLNIDYAYQKSSKKALDCTAWKDALNGSLTPPTLRPVKPITKPAISVTTQFTDLEFWALMRVAQVAEVSWPEWIYAAVAAFIIEKTGNPECTLGIPVMNRLGTPAARVPAMVMNIVPLRVDLREEIESEENADTRPLKFSDVFQHSVDFWRRTKRHHQYRYEHLRRDMSAVGGERRLFGPVVNVLPFERQLTDAESDISTSVIPVSAGPVEDISFTFFKTACGHLKFSLDGNPNAYSQDYLGQLSRQFTEHLRQWVNDANTALCIDEQSLAISFNPPCSMSTPDVLKQFTEQVNATPLSNCIEQSGQIWSYQNVLESAFAISTRIRSSLSREVNEHTPPVVLLLARGAQAIMACLGVLASRRGYLFLDPNGPKSRNDWILENVQPEMVIYEGGQFEFNGPWQTFDVVECLMSVNSECAHTVEWAQAYKDVSGRELAYCIYTSGSTGTPKGVQIGRSALSEFVFSAIHEYGIDTSDRILQFAPLHFDASVEEIFLALCSGATLVVRNEQMLESMALFNSTCEAWRISVLDLPTAFWHEWVLHGEAANAEIASTLKTVIIGGEAAQAECVEAWHCWLWHQNASQRLTLLNTYGPSETTVVASFTSLQPQQPLTIGRPLAGRGMAVVNSDGFIVNKEQEGELVLFGQGLGLGYVGDPTLTAEKFSPLRPLFWRGSPRSYRTGDKVRMLSSGHCEFIGRIDDEIKISGHRIQPLEVEATLLTLESVVQAAVVCKRISGACVLLAAVVCKSSQVQPLDLKKRLSEILPAPMVPSQIRVELELPKTTSGKIDRKQLLASFTLDNSSNSNSYSSGAAQGEYENLSLTQKTIAGIWKTVLNVSSVRLEDDFFLIGGQSLQTIQVASRLSIALNKNIDVSTLFSYPTLMGLSRALESAHLEDKPSVQLQAESDAQSIVQVLPTNGVKPSRQIDSVLLTGASGFLGAQLLATLVSKGVQVICLVRARNMQHGLDKITKALSDQKIVVKNLHKKLVVLVGDAAQPQLGLKDAIYAKWVNTVQAVIHNAANTSVMRDYSSLHGANVLATANTRRFAAMANAHYHFVSTIAVSESDYLSEDYVPWHDNLQDGYQQTKWAAERTLQHAAAAGWSSTIYRLGRITGSFDTGYVNPQDLAWRIVAASCELKSYPALDLEEPWASVSDLAKCIVTNVQSMEVDGVVNLVPDTLFSMATLFDWLNEYGLNLKSQSMKDWLEHLNQSSNESCRALATFFSQRRSVTGLPPIQKDKANFLLSKKSIALGPPSYEQFIRFIHYALSHQIIQARSETPIFEGVTTV